MGTLPHLSILKGPVRPLKPEYLHKIFEKLATTTAAENTAIIFEENSTKKSLTYSELNTITNQLSNVLLQKIKEEQLKSNNDGDYIIAVSLTPSDLLVATLLAIWKTGAAYLPLDPTFPAARIEHILKESKPALVIFDEDKGFFSSTQKLSIKDLTTKARQASTNPINDESRLRHAKDDLAIVLYTSGSTGVPKGVRIPHKIILNRLQWQFKTFPYSKTEKMGIFKTALTFVDSVSEIWGPLISGVGILVIPKMVTKDPEKLVELLERYKIERLVLVPSLLRTLLMYLEMEGNKKALQHLKTWVCSGETLVVSLVEEFFKFFSDGRHQLCNFYGSTEVMGDVTYYVMSALQQVKHMEKVPIGLPVDNTMIYLLDSDYRPVKAGEVGELFVSGLNLAAGYVNNRDPDRFVDNPLAIDPTYSKLYKTGDFARIEKGVLIYEGRTDSQVKIRGHRVDLSEIEKAVLSVKEVEKAVVLCYKPGEMNQALVAFVTASAFANESQIEEALKGKLAAYMVPQVILIESVPLLVNGKVDRQGLLQMFENNNNNNNDTLRFQVDIDYSGVPKDKMEAAKVLFETVATVLNQSARKAISYEANFYEIGGNSLNSVFTVTRLHDQGYHISIADFIGAMDFGEILERMVPGKEALTLKAKPPVFTSDPLKNEYKDVVVDMITTSFYQKADLEQWILSYISEADYTELMDALWEPLLEKGLSFVAKSEDGKVVGVALNFDARDEPEVQITSKLEVIFEFLESIEGPVRDSQLPKEKGKILHSFMMATHSSLTPKENVAVMQFMEDEELKLARSRGFSGIFTTNTSPLTQQLGSDVYNYKTMLDYQVNEFVASDGTKPFGLAPDSQRAVVQWKPI